MEERRKNLFKKIVDIYIKTAEPVGSLRLSAGTAVSSATIRHEMKILEQEGLIYQPHTSAGRVPTEKGYRFYIENFVKNGKMNPKERARFAGSSRNLRGDELLKHLARAVARMTQEAVIVVFDTHHLYFTGLSHLFAKPEFEERARVMVISDVLDQCEEILPAVLALVKKKKILLGRENPFGSLCSFISLPIQGGGMFGLLGPMRMDYARNLGIIEMIGKLL